jgi:hypothetical protein
MSNAKPSSRRRGRKSIKRPGELGKPIRPLAVRPQGFPVPDDPVAIALANAEMEALHTQAVDEARIQKLELLLRHYELADDDWFGLALKLAIEHEPGFQVNRQIGPLPLPPGSYVLPADIVALIGVEALNRTFANGFPVHVKDGEILEGPDRPNRRRACRPTEWPVDRLDSLFEAVQVEKEKYDLNDTDAVRRLANRKEWQRPENHRGDFEGWVATLRTCFYRAGRLRRKASALQTQLYGAARRTGKKCGKP